MVVQLQQVSPSGRRIASLDAEVPEILVTDEAARERQRLPLGDLRGISGFHWLASGRGLVVWTLDRVHVVGLDGDRELAFAIDQPDGLPLSVEDVRVLPRGLLVVAQTCGMRHVKRHAFMVHLDGAHVVGTTDLEPWSGSFLYAATPLRDGRIVLALTEQEHIGAARQQCLRQLAARRDPSTSRQVCWYMTLRERFFASEFRVLRVHRPNVVEIAGNHACPEDDGCYVQNWAPSATEIVWTGSGRTYRLRSPVSPSVLMPEGGVWASWDTSATYPAPTHSLWMERGRILSASAENVWTTALDGRVLRRWGWRDDVKAVRFTPDGSKAIVALSHRIVELDVDTERVRTLFEMIDVPSAFDAGNHGLYFADARRSRSGVLAFDVVRSGAPQRSVVTVAAGRLHEGCHGDSDDAVESTESDLVPSEHRYRELLPWVRKRTRAW